MNANIPVNVQTPVVLFDIHWLKLSIEYAQQRNYLDELFRVYPTIPD